MTRSAFRRPPPPASVAKGLITGLAIVAVGLSTAMPSGASASGHPYNRAAGETPSRQPVPRYVSLRFDKVNGRAGPARDYPVRWVYARRGLPVRVTAETEDWRRIEDPQGGQVWVHKRTLDGRRTAIARPTRDARVALRRNPDSGARVNAWLADGVITEILEERPGWRLVRVGHHRGWASAAELWGAGTT